MKIKLPVATITPPKKAPKRPQDADAGELIASRSLVVLDHERNRLVEPVSVRLYMGRARTASVVRCVFRAWSDDTSLIGYGRAGGGNYCKQSAACGEAFASAGVKLRDDVHGRGMSTVDDALVAIAAALGYDMAQPWAVVQ